MRPAATPLQPLARSRGDGDYLWKKGNFRKNWKRRYWKTDGRCMVYYENEQSQKPLGRVDLDRVWSFHANSTDFEFTVCTPERVWSLRTESKESLTFWLDFLDRTIQMPSFKLIKEGFMHKAGKINTALQYRYFILCTNALLYFENKECTQEFRMVVEQSPELFKKAVLDESLRDRLKVRGAVILRDSTVERIGNRVFLRTTRRVFELVCDNSEYASEWEAALRQATIPGVAETPRSRREREQAEQEMLKVQEKSVCKDRGDVSSAASSAQPGSSLQTSNAVTPQATPGGVQSEIHIGSPIPEVGEGGGGGGGGSVQVMGSMVVNVSKNDGWENVKL